MYMLTRPANTLSARRAERDAAQGGAGQAPGDRGQGRPGRERGGREADQEVSGFAASTA